MKSPTFGTALLRAVSAVTGFSLLALAACSGSGSGSPDTVTVNGDVPIAYV